MVQKLSTLNYPPWKLTRYLGRNLRSFKIERAAFKSLPLGNSLFGKEPPYRSEVCSLSFVSLHHSKGTER